MNFTNTDSVNQVVVLQVYSQVKWQMYNSVYEQVNKQVYLQVFYQFNPHRYKIHLEIKK